MRLEKQLYKLYLVDQFGIELLSVAYDKRDVKEQAEMIMQNFSNCNDFWTQDDTKLAWFKYKFSEGPDSVPSLSLKIMKCRIDAIA